MIKFDETVLERVILTIVATEKKRKRGLSPLFILIRFPVSGILWKLYFRIGAIDSTSICLMFPSVVIHHSKV